MKYTNKFLGALCLAAFGFASCADDYSLLDYDVEKPISVQAYEYLNDYKPLKEYVNSANPDFKLGTGITVSDYNTGGLVYRVAAANYDELTAGNAMKHSSIVADNGAMDFGAVTAFVSQAQTAGQTIYGHTLAWHSQQRNKYLNDLLKDKEIPVDPDAKVEVDVFFMDFEDGKAIGGWGNSSIREVLPEGPDGSNCLVITNPSVANSWNAQAAIDMAYEIGVKHVSTFKIKATGEGTLGLEFQNPETYAGCGSFADIKFGTEWKEVKVEATTQEGAGRYIFSFGAFAGTIYIDDLRLYKEEAAAVNYWEELVTNGDAEGDDFSSFVAQEVTAGRITPKVSEPGKGADGVGRAYMVVAEAGGAGENWDSQFFISAPKAFEVDDKIKFTMKYRADGDGFSTETQQHGDPGNYIYWQFIGYPTFNTEWQTFEYTGTISNEGVRTIAFNLWATKTPTTYYFDDISWQVERSGNTIPLTAEEKKDTITWAMNNWISGMMAATGGYVTAWDVVNEPISGTDADGDGYYDLWSSKNPAGEGHFYWTDYLGNMDYVRTAVKQAREHFAANGGNAADLKLFINDYNLESDWDDNKKLKSLINWIEKWEEDGETVIDGIGTQMHVSCYANPATQASKEAAVENMFKLMAETGKLVKVSELDMGYVDADGNSVATENMTEAQHFAMAEYYKFIIKKYFELIPAEQQYGITHWSPTDSPKGSGWRAGMPIGLWDANYNRKHVYAGFADGLAGAE